MKEKHRERKYAVRFVTCMGIMMRKMLMTASVPSMIGAFNMNNIKILKNMGYEVHVACDFSDRSVWDKKKIRELVRELKLLQIKCHQIDFSRKVYDFHRHIKAYKQLVQLLSENQFTFIHCHAPISGIITRSAAKKQNVKIIYTAHGFHFFKGAPVINWLLFYPLEKYYAKYTDILVTINSEDYNRALKKFKAKRIYKIPSVGLDNARINQCHINRNEKRKEMDIPEDGFVLISVGELSKRKNQEVILRAVGRIKDDNIYYLLAGVGENEQAYQKLIDESGMSKNIFLLGRREDVIELCKMSDVFVHPSIREGLGMAPLEGMAAGLPLISSNVNGINDYSVNGITGYSCRPDDIDGFVRSIHKLKHNPELRKRMGEHNKTEALKFDLSVTEKIMTQIYKEIKEI